MRKELAIALSLVPLVILTAWWLMRPTPTPETPEAPPEPIAEPPVPPASELDPAPPAQAPRRARTFSEGSRVHIPRPAVDMSAADAPSQAVEERQQALGTLPTTLSAEEIQDVVQGQVIEPVKECVLDWMELDPGLEGEVVVGFTLGPEGLMDVEIVDHSDVPAGPLSCFASAVWEAGWPAVDGEVVVNYPFVFTQEEEPELP